MRSPALLFLLASSSYAAVAVPLQSSHRASRLETRAGQQLTNPDNEPPYQDEITGAMKEKSRVLSGVGPAAADSRYFDWDESCSDAGQRERIVLAWDAFQSLTTSSSRRLGNLIASLPNQPVGVGGNPDEGNREYIIANDPAYTQMFKARDIGLQWIQRSYDLITNNVQNFPGRGGGRPPALRFICNADDHVKDGQGKPFCGAGATAAQAQTVVPQRAFDTTIEQQYRFSTASSITFCPVFFDDIKMPNINSVWNNDQIKPDLSNVDCRERVMLHEYMHLPWVRNMRPNNDVEGFVKAADVAATLAWGSVRSTPDCYAWYALYSAYNNDHKGCGRDIWPSGVDKPVTE